MKFDIRRHSTAHTLLLAVLLSSALLLPFRAQAALGGSVSSVEADQQKMKAERVVQSKETYSVHQITTPYGTVVREYVSPQGQVFGVAWRGAFLPDFSQILGSYYPEFVKAAQQSRSAAQPRRSRNAPLAVNNPDFVMHSAGHAHAFVGSAYLPGSIPQGVDAQQIR